MKTLDSEKSKRKRVRNLCTVNSMLCQKRKLLEVILLLFKFILLFIIKFDRDNLYEKRLTKGEINF